MARISKAAAERKADSFFYELGNGAQIPIFDLAKVSNPVRDAIINGATDEAARALMAAQIAKYRQN